MAWTYDPAQVGTDPLFQVRFLIQDTVSTRPLCQDEELNFLIANEANVYMAAAAACDSLVARSAGVQSRRVGDLALTYDPKFYRSLGATLRARGMSHQLPSAGGLSVADKIAQASDSDAVRPSFVRGIDENPGAPQPSGISPNPLGRPPSP